MMQLNKNKKSVFRVARPYLNWLVKPRFFSQVFWKNIILFILKGILSFKMHKIIFFYKKKNNKKKNVCLPYHTFFY